MSNQDTENNKTVFVKIVFFAVIVGVTALIVWLLSYKKESHITNKIPQSNYSVLECKSSEPKEPFFSSDDASSRSYDIKVLFTDGALKELSYRYDGVFESESAAKNAEARMHADYNKYMDANRFRAESLNPSFSIIDSNLVVSLYADVTLFNRVVGRLFFISDEEFDKVQGYSEADYKKMYTSLGFICEIHE